MPGKKPKPSDAPAPAEFKPIPAMPVESQLGARVLAGGKHGKFYVTTAINYTNGAPHIGHAYEALTADVIARYYRVAGFDTYFLTGTDEHGQKIAQTAESKGLKPKELCDMYVAQFQSLNKRLQVSNDSFIRTTHQYHEDCCRALWKKCADAGDIYLGEYEGWYNTREECFVPDAEAQANDFKDPDTGKPYERMKESSYFFRLGRYQQALLKHIKENPGFIQPEEKKQGVLEFLGEELRDLCVSRTTFDWGVLMPEGFDAGHVMYVWFDALTNYLSETRLLTEPGHPLSRLWPADCHVIGKDIVRFHCVYWPCMLMSAGLPLPKTVFGHGFVHAADGRKMSKSFGNVVDPNKILDKYPSDSFRFYICNEATYGADLKFGPGLMVQMHNSSLADTLGNLANRAVSLCGKYCGGVVPEFPKGCEEVPLPFDLDSTRKQIHDLFAKYDLKGACCAAMEVSRASNKWIADLEPWKMKDESLEAKRVTVVRYALEAVYVLAHFLAPFHPVASTAILLKLSSEPTALPDLDKGFRNLKAGAKITEGGWEGCGQTLFPKLPEPVEEAAPAAAVRTDAPLPKAPRYPPGKPQAVDAEDALFRFLQQ
eukprot:TRINITY_DN315_c0_g1_i4.p1 TRINITY_DN315_c0_g1~~TRINITY_DN315_c0_g1_i4.p1  ORF type:complete len:598 (+),score=171.17 TRINITY_DN315_c0_g1_i4:141-1934(+)